ncbi:hypothetical protein K2X85_02325 [bacterium]|nr:hypothetical protein [bacterium]
MSVSESLHKLVEARIPFRNRLEPMVASEQGVTVRCDVTQAEGVGCMLTHLDLVEENKSSLSMDELVHWAEWMCGRVTYLLEPLHLIEIDRRNGLALVRSKMPRRQNSSGKLSENIAYFELVADRRHHASLRRFQFRRTTRDRGSVPFGLTHDQLEVLVDDLVEGALAKNP